MRFSYKAVVIASISVLMSVTTMASSNGWPNRILKGDYGSSLNGTVNGLPFAAVNLVSADGDGHITGSGTIVLDGAVIPSRLSLRRMW